MLLAPMHLPDTDESVQALFISAHIADLQRDTLEQAISKGFQLAYNAKLTAFMPLLCQYTTPRGQCTLGLRRASSALFIEQYLASPIESFINEQTHRSDIFELGNLFSTERKATLTNFVIVNEALQHVGAKYLAFCATKKVRALLRVLGVTCTEIALANSFVLDQPDNWGSYYTNKPTVCLVNLTQAHEQVMCTPMLYDLMQQNHHNIGSLTNELEKL